MAIVKRHHDLFKLCTATSVKAAEKTRRGYNFKEEQELK